MNDVVIHHEVRSGAAGEWQLCFQWVTYALGDGARRDSGYRFIWRRPDGTLQPARGQARIPSAAALLGLLQQASAAGWFVRAESEGPLQAELALEPDVRGSEAGEVTPDG